MGVSQRANEGANGIVQANVAMPTVAVGARMTRTVPAEMTRTEGLRRVHKAVRGNGAALSAPLRVKNLDKLV